MPLFLELVRDAATRDPALAKAALEGLRRYQAAAPAGPTGIERPVLDALGSAKLRDCGGVGDTIVLIPSLINPPNILDLDPDCSLAEALAMRHRVLLLDWGPADGRGDLDLNGHVEQLMLPLLEKFGPVSLVGYCLGGTLALAAAARRGMRAVVTLAAPWDFACYPRDASERLQQIWRASEPVAAQLGFLPMEVLQAAFWQIDPERIVAKFARFAGLATGSAEERRFVAMEDWANGGEPLPLPAARQLVDELFGGGGRLGALPTCPMLHFTATADRIVPAGTAAPTGRQIEAGSGHVGMIVGRDAPRRLHAPLLSWLEALPPHG